MMLQEKPNIGEMIMHHTSDAHEIAFESPFGGELFTIHLPRQVPRRDGQSREATNDTASSSPQ